MKTFRMKISERERDTMRAAVWALEKRKLQAWCKGSGYAGWWLDACASLHGQLIALYNTRPRQVEFSEKDLFVLRLAMGEQADKAHEAVDTCATVCQRLAKLDTFVQNLNRY